MTPGATGRIVGMLRRCLCIAAALLIPSTIWASAACVAPDGGIGGTGAPAQNGGIGGTGAPRPLENGGVGGTGSPQPAGHGGIGGIGGTGQQADGGMGGTGIVGIVTGFGSVCVNGLEVHYDATTPVNRNGLPALADQLALGQVIAIEAAGKNGQLRARRISILEALAGPTTQVDVASGQLRVMGQTVKISGDTRLVGVGHLDELAVGVALHVSGYRDAADQVVASRLEVARGMDGVSAIGPLGGMGETVGGVAISRPSAAPAAGTEVLVRGTWDGSRLRVASVQSDPTLPFFGRVDKVVLEGLVLEHRGAGQLRISGFDVHYSAATGIDGGDFGQAQEGLRVRVTGRLDVARRLQAERIELLPLGVIGRAMRHDRVDAKVEGRPGNAPARPAIGSMAVPLAIPQRMLPAIRPSQGLAAPAPGVPLPPRGMGR